MSGIVRSVVVCLAMDQVIHIRLVSSGVPSAGPILSGRALSTPSLRSLKIHDSSQVPVSLPSGRAVSLEFRGKQGLRLIGRWSAILTSSSQPRSKEINSIRDCPSTRHRSRTEKIPTSTAWTITLTIYPGCTLPHVPAWANPILARHPSYSFLRILLAYLMTH
ncbi:hypothetical protein TMatcc_005026 [Talaromyces marneffei ATCC 18224]